mmetsp:Transcript_21599/g.54552  ORF Transcript_21599/g.54552 Transcript_21599/m.54552 type:complete len:627 (+) Transcript_21599:607-2487(+)|eukprot:CAMPEP_0178994528 /NCGR_PEP_ID=MMETSP0795-20121207/7321_1 /TAXON_ID=88552 /ORGANISM="Amoebophrya sp., Strain Ameob2" /LENGTH=626 /DNA_ID=CAMNT_0020686733 /DNA_START=565 /DNA_END=2445 /DNA_ORIENTATION=-
MGKGGNGKGGGNKSLKRHPTDDAIAKFLKVRVVPMNDQQVQSELRAYAQDKNYNVGNMQRDYENSAAAGPLRTAVDAARNGGSGDAEAEGKADALADAVDAPSVIKLMASTSPADVAKWSPSQKDRALANVQLRLNSISTWATLLKAVDLFSSEWSDFPFPDQRDSLTILLLGRVIDVCRVKRAYKGEKRFAGAIVDAVDNTTAIADAQKTTKQMQQEVQPKLADVEDVKKWLQKYPVLQQHLGTIWTKMVELPAAAFSHLITNYLNNNDDTTAIAIFLKKIQPMASEAASSSVKDGNQDLLHRGALNVAPALTQADKNKLKAYAFTATEVLKALSDCGGKVLGSLSLTAADRTTRWKRITPLLAPVLQKVVDKIIDELDVFYRTYLGGDKNLLINHIVEVEWQSGFNEVKAAMSEPVVVEQIRAGMKEEWLRYAEVAKACANAANAMPVASTKIVKTACTIKRSYIACHAVVITNLKTATPTAAQVADVKANTVEALNALAKHHAASMQHLAVCIQDWQKKMLSTTLASFHQRALGLKTDSTTTVEQCQEWRKDFETNRLLWGLDEIDVKKLNNDCTWLKETAREATEHFKAAQDAAMARQPAAQGQQAAAAAGSVKIVKKGAAL